MVNRLTGSRWGTVLSLAVVLLSLAICPVAASPPASPGAEEGGRGEAAIPPKLPAAWVAGAPFPSTLIRAAGVWYPPNGRFYVVGGRTSGLAGSDLATPYEYDPGTNTWSASAAVWPTNQNNNMAAAYLVGPTGPGIYAVGGSAAGSTACTSDVRLYDPVAGTISVIATDPWPGNTTNDFLPGGFAVFNNRLYIFGGFQVNIGMVAAIWEFNPMAGAGAMWTLKAATLPTALGYIPATTLGNYIYIGGGAEYFGSLTDSDFSYRYDPVADAIAPIPNIPRSTSNTRAITLGGQMWVLGGGFNAVSNQVDAYSPGTSTWSLGIPFATARRNFAADVDPATGRVFIVGGYDNSGVDNPINGMEILTPCGPPPPVPTISAGGPTTFCPGRSVTLTSSAAAGNQWLMNGLDIPGATGTSYVATATGSYAVRATAAGCSSVSWPVTVWARTPAPAAWTPGAPFPTTITRACGVWYPPTGRFYALGGRMWDGAGNDLMTPYEYDPIANIWTQKPALFPSNENNNMAAAFLMGPSGPGIYMVGGSAGGFATATGAVRVYDPATGAITVLAADPWPGVGANDILPGGYAVYHNKLYILGGFQVNVAMVNAIWEFDPMAPAGARWTLKAATLPAPLGYIPATTIGNYIYTAGGTDYVGGTLVDTNLSYRYDPVADVIVPIAPIPRLASNTRAVNQGGQMWVLGGGFPGESNEVDAYDPIAGTWGLGLPFTLPRRNAAVDIDPATGRIFMAGGYIFSSPDPSMEIYTPAQPGPPVPTITPGGSTTICPGGSVTLTSSAPAANQWQLDGMDIPGETGTSMLASLAGSYTVRVTDGGGCSATSWPISVFVKSPGPAAWNPGAAFPSTLTRAVGVWYPPNGRFYVVGGRTAGAGTSLANPYEYDPFADTWAQMGALWPDADVCNMAAAFLTGPSGPAIYTVGGSSGGSVTATWDVRIFDPVADTITVLTTDPWPGNTTWDVLPGGFAVHNNRLYIFGGFQINVGMVNSIWRFDPLAAPWSKWTLMAATLPVPLGYIPAATIGSYIYLGGGADFPGGINDTNLSYRYDPAADAIVAIPNIPRATSNTLAVNQGGQMWVLGGAFNAVSNEVDAYDPLTNAWGLGTAFLTARRNAAADIEPVTGRIFMVGGYDASGLVPLDNMEIFSPAVDGPTAVVSGGGSTCPTGWAIIQAALTGTPPWSLTWSDGVTQSGIWGSPALRAVNPPVDTTYTVVALNDANCPGTSSGSALVTATPLIVVSPATIPSGIVGFPYTATFSAAGGVAPLVLSMTGTVPGLTFSALTGVLSGTPTAAGNFSITITATDANGCTGSRTYTLVIAPYDLNFFDNYGKSRLCMNSVTGGWAWSVLAGTGLGTYSGIGTLSQISGVVYLRSKPGEPWTLTAKYYPAARRASGSFTYRLFRINSYLTDSNTTNNPPGC